MAKVSPLLAIMSGSIGGNTWARNKGGLYIKMKASPTNPNSARQQAVRGFMATASGQWQGLTAPQQDAWDLFALIHPKQDPLGQEYFLTGHQWYVALQSVVLDQGLVQITDPPSGPEPVALLSATVTFTADTAVSVVFTATPLAADEAIYLWQGVPQGGTGDPNFAQARLVGYSAQAAASPQAFTLPMTASSGFTSNFWVGIVDGDGRSGPSTKDSDTRP
jgi:hypothetical protein